MNTSDPIFSIILKAITEGQFHTPDWIKEDINGDEINWTLLRFKKSPFKDQGFKLHISSSVNSAEEVLRRVLPILSAEKVSFKVTTTLADLIRLNNGNGGLSQIGKFITIYPFDEDHTIKLADSLDRLTKDLSGPLIPYERCIRPSSCIYYRYGSFTNLSLQTNIGATVPAIRDPEGRYHPDKRDTLELPSWVSDPFVRNGFKPSLKRIDKILFGRYLRVKQIDRSPRGSTWIGLDLEGKKIPLIVIKEALRHVMTDTSGFDAIDELRNEFNVLKTVQEFDSYPFVIDYRDSDHNSFLIYKYIEGITLSSLINSISSRGGYLDENIVIKWGLELCHILKLLHSQKIIYRDLKPRNILIDKSNRLHLIDFGISVLKEQHVRLGFGTYGYASQSQLKGGLPSRSDDIYSLGAVLYSMNTMLDLSKFPVVSDPLYRLRFLNPYMSDGMKSIIQLCMKPRGSGKCDNINYIENRLLKLSMGTHATSSNRNYYNESRSQYYLSLATKIGDLICKKAEHSNGSAYWISRHPSTLIGPERGLFIGCSGIGIFLVDLYRTTKNQLFLSTAEKAAAWLKNSEQKIGRDMPLTGLFVGESGVGMFYLHLYQATGNALYLDLAVGQSNLVSESKNTSPDLFNGAAGVGLFHLMLAEVTKDNKILQRAIDIGKSLQQAVEVNNGTYQWRLPSGLDSMSGEVYLGFAHGIAGIGYFLFELGDVTNEKIFVDIGSNVAEYLLHLRKTTLKDNSGLNWPVTSNTDECGLYWCHGATGIGQFFLKAFEVTSNKRYEEVAFRAAKTVSEGGRWVGTTQCHGLAGNIEFLLDLFQLTGKRHILDLADEMGRLLETYKTFEKNNYVIWPSEEPKVFTPDYMVGYSGVGSCFLRMAHPSLPRWISRKAFNNYNVH